jgi:DNA-binding NarL/FixJ family response regulator
VLNLLQPHLQRAYANAQLVDASLRAGRLDPDRAQRLGLTKREAEVAHWLAEGKTNAEIGRILGTATRTVEKHVEHLLTKLHVENRTTAAIEVRNGRMADT